MNLLFVCLGNICRSPAAEAIMNKLIDEASLTDQITCDSAGTSQYHAGRPADFRMKKEAQAKGYNINSISRAFEMKDFDDFDWIITMDDSNYENIMSLAKKTEHRKKILKMAGFCKTKTCHFIPDPYHGESQSFANVISLMEDSCLNLLKKIKSEQNV